MLSKPTILIRIRRTGSKWTYAQPVYAANNRLKPHYATVGGKPEHHPEGVYYLRFSANGRRHFKRAGSHPDEAKAALARHQFLLHGLAMGIDSPELPPPTRVPTADSKRQRWDAAVQTYMLEIEARRGSKTATAYRYTLKMFAAACPVTYLDEISRGHILKYEASIGRKGNAARTAYNRVAQLGTFLRYWKLSEVVLRKDLPRYTKKLPVAYTLAALNQLFAAATDLEKLLFEFFLVSGCREQEVMFMTAQDIDLEGSLVRVLAKPEWKWQPKDKEERCIPIPRDLVEKLGVHIRAFPPQQRLLFPVVADRTKPNGHMLRQLKNIALRAGLNCGHCITKGGGRCSVKSVCKQWSLHAFRRTFATVHHRNGVSVRTLMDWLGHSDLATVLAYLASEDTKSEATRVAVNRSFAAIGL
jgi:integrase/recombinase XerD